MPRKGRNKGLSSAAKGQKKYKASQKRQSNDSQVGPPYQAFSGFQTQVDQNSDDQAGDSDPIYRPRGVDYQAGGSGLIDISGSVDDEGGGSESEPFDL